LVLALNWCFFVFAFSYGNALADQKHYADFRISLLLHDISTLSQNQSGEVVQIQLENGIDFSPSVKNISKRNPIIKKLVPKLLGGGFIWDELYLKRHFNFIASESNSVSSNDMPLVLDSYYHTIKSDGKQFYVIIKH